MSESMQIPPLAEKVSDIEAHIRNQTALIARDGGRIIGSARGIVAGAVCTIRGVSVDPACQGRGIGSDLLRAIEDAHPRIERFELTTNTLVPGNVAFYERRGYRVIELRNHTPNIVLARMRKRRVAADVSLRDATDKDAEAVADLLILGRSRFMPYAPAVHSDAEVRARVRDQLIPNGCVVVAAGPDALLGVMAVSASVDGSWIQQMWVDHAHVGKGIGTMLLAHAVASLPSPLRLYTFQANTGARRFYEHHGFVAIDFSDGHANEERCPDVLYERRASTAA